MTESSIRAVAILKAKAGQEQVLVDFTLQSLASIRNVDGLRKVEVSRSLSDPGQLVLYYWWESSGHSERYLAGPVFASIAPGLQALVDKHSLVLTEIVSG
ncbi:MAG: antibiotic biosynthesis monooxygenase [Bradyrhizobiaceae bacterium]|nr:antibiotic biosynthesis monooxygenase [Bradyrhizobiaceae bacterium]